MHAVHSRAAAFAVVVCLAAGAALGAPGAHATTGPSQNLPSTFKVNSAFAGQFIGEYVLKTVPATAHIASAALAIEMSSAGFLHGIGQFYGYDRSGRQSSWVAELYRFHQTGKAQMTVDLLAPGTGNTVLGHLVVAPPQHETLAGAIQLAGRTYPVTFHRISRR